MIATLTYGPDGKGRGLYTEAIDLLRLGVLHIERATTIEFDNKIQAWRVRDTSGTSIFAAASRQECLDWEQHHFSHQADDASCAQSSEEITNATTERKHHHADDARLTVD